MKQNILELINFLADYASTMISVGSYNSRVSRCVKRIAAYYGYDASIFVLLKHISISVTDIDNYENRRTYVKDITQHSINLSMISELSALSWSIKDENLTLDEAKKIYKEILKTKGTKFGLSIIFISAAFGAFCKLFGGDFWSIFFVIIGTMAGVSIRHFLNKKNMDIRVTYIICSFISSFIAYLATDFDLSKTPTPAISASILYLFPGIVILNSMFDILDQNVLIGISRAVNAAILILCMSVGIYITLGISNLGLL